MLKKGQKYTLFDTTFFSIIFLVKISCYEISREKKGCVWILNYLLNDELNLEILKLICSGKGVDINVNYLSRKLNKHRTTIYQKITKLLEHRIIEKPIYNFYGLLNELPLLVMEKGDFPRTPEINHWIEKDPHIWGAFFVKYEDFNTFLIILQKDLYTYQEWKESFLENEKFKSSIQQNYYPSEVVYLSTKNIIKYKPHVSIPLISNYLKIDENFKLSNLRFDTLTLDILATLANGEGISTNYNELSKLLNVHRKTIQRRVDILLQNNLINPPSCYFPRKWSPPDFILVFSLIEIKKYKNRLFNYLLNDNHIPLAIKTQANNYNLVTFGNFYKIEDHLTWMEDIDQRFPDTIGAIKNLYLSPKMTFSISLNYVALTYIDKLLNELYGKKLKKMMD